VLRPGLCQQLKGNCRCAGVGERGEGGFLAVPYIGVGWVLHGQPTWMISGQPAEGRIFCQHGEKTLVAAAGMNWGHLPP